MILAKTYCNYLKALEPIQTTIRRLPFVEQEVLILTKRCPWCGKREKRLVLHPTGSPFLAECPFCHHMYGQNNHDKSMVIPGLLCIVFVLLCFLHSLFILPALLLLFFMMSNIFTLPYLRLEKDKLTGRYRLAEDSMSQKYEAKYGSSENAHPSFKVKDIFPTTADFDQQACYTQSAPIQIVKKSPDSFQFQLLYDHPENPPYEAGLSYTIYVKDQPCEIVVLDTDIPKNE